MIKLGYFLAWWIIIIIFQTGIPESPRSSRRTPLANQQNTAMQDSGDFTFLPPLQQQQRPGGSMVQENSPVKQVTKIHHDNILQWAEHSEKIFIKTCINVYEKSCGEVN